MELWRCATIVTATYGNELLREVDLLLPVGFIFVFAQVGFLFQISFNIIKSSKRRFKVLFNKHAQQDYCFLNT